MNLANDVIPLGGALQDTHAPADRTLNDSTEQGPLGARPTYDEVLDAAVDYTFPCSDPIAAGACCEMAARDRT